MPVSIEVLGERLQKARINLNMTQEKVADVLGLPRTAMVQIESGGRTVSSLELVKLASLYGRAVADLLAEVPQEDDPVVLFRQVLEADGEGLGPEAIECIELFREATTLRGYLGDKPRLASPTQQYAEPTSYQEAVAQGKEMATVERHRLNLGSAPIADMADLICSQGIWAAAVAMRNEVSGLFLHSKAYGLAIVVNQTHHRARRRFSYAHEYAHALVDRNKISTPSSTANKNELIEKRANSFASEFLLPEAGIKETLDQLRKGASVREYSILYDPTSNIAEPHESRRDPGSQRITVQEVAILAHKFQVSYEVATYRLSDIGAIKKPHLDGLLNQKEEGRILIKELKLYNGDEPGPDQENPQPYLKQQIAFLAIECYRREKISSGRFREICKKAGYKANDLMKVAEATTGE